MNIQTGKLLLSFLPGHFTLKLLKSVLASITTKSAIAKSQTGKMLHAWGAKDQDGFYRNLAKECGIKPKSAGEVKDEIGIVSPGEAFKYICNGLERQVPNLPTLYDVILIDEGQDLPDSFYRLAYGTLYSLPTKAAVLGL